MIVPSKEQFILLHRHMFRATGGSEGLRDEGLLESAIAAPFQSFGGCTAYPTIEEKAARLGFGLIRNHPFVDGNKRIGAHAMLVFLALNHIGLAYTQGELSNCILDLAAGNTGYDELLAWIRAHRV